VTFPLTTTFADDIFNAQVPVDNPAPPIRFPVIVNVPVFDVLVIACADADPPAPPYRFPTINWDAVGFAVNVATLVVPP
jgi:hypothetical protein